MNPLLVQRVFYAKKIKIIDIGESKNSLFCKRSGNKKGLTLREPLCLLVTSRGLKPLTS